MVHLSLRAVASGPGTYRCIGYQYETQLECQPRPPPRVLGTCCPVSEWYCNSSGLKLNCQGSRKGHAGNCLTRTPRETLCTEAVRVGCHCPTVPRHFEQRLAPLRDALPAVPAAPPTALPSCAQHLSFCKFGTRNIPSRSRQQAVTIKKGKMHTNIMWKGWRRIQLKTMVNRCAGSTSEKRATNLPPWDQRNMDLLAEKRADAYDRRPVSARPRAGSPAACQGRTKRVSSPGCLRKVLPAYFASAQRSATVPQSGCM